MDPAGQAPPVLEIVSATTPADLNAVRDLVRGFVAWQRQRNAADLALIDQYFAPATIEAELAGLPGQYAPPQGRLLLVRSAGQPTGCVALRALEAGAGEMKRMFVDARYQRQGVGRALAQAVIQEAKTVGYAVLRLDTSFRQVEAQRLYHSLGFQNIDPYYAVTPELRRWLVFMELWL